MSTKPRTIVHIITSLDVGGAERSLTNLVSSMDRHKFNNVVVSLKDLGFFGAKLQQQGIRVIALNLNYSLLVLPRIFNFWRFLRQLKPDVIQGWMYHANIFALLIGKMAGVKFIYWNIRCSLMDLSQYNLGTKFIYKLGAALSRWPHGIINNSQNSIEEHKRAGYKNANWLYIPNGLNTDDFVPNAEIYTRFRVERKLPTSALLIGMVARFDPMKDHATFVQAAGILAAQLPHVYFVCVGRGVNMANPALRSEITRANLQNKIILLDQMEQVNKLYPAFDYLTQTSIFGEGFPNVVAEAMACGVPCFVTDVGDSLTVIGECGYKIPKSDPKALAEIWHKVINGQTLQQTKNNARQRIIQSFSIERYVNSYAEVYVN